MTALIIDLAATADAHRAAKATGQPVAQIRPAPIKASPGDQVYDPESRMCGFFSHFISCRGKTFAVIQGNGCSFAAKLPDLVPVFSTAQSGAPH